MKRYTNKIEVGVKHLLSNDAVMRQLIERCSPLTCLKLEHNRFQSLVNAILSQQISIHAARSVQVRLLKYVGKNGINPNRIANLEPKELHALGISKPKALYLLELARKVESGQLLLNNIGRLSDEDLIEKLITGKGIGVLTAQMFMIFLLGRMDVLPWNDYAIRLALQRLYHLKGLPDKDRCLQIAKPWRPYATIGSWYCWRSHSLHLKED